MRFIMPPLYMSINMLLIYIIHTLSTFLYIGKNLTYLSSIESIYHHYPSIKPYRIKCGL
jgi:hypothetical protein